MIIDTEGDAAAAAPELSDQLHRRTLTVQYKLRVLAEIDRAPAGGTGAILRREDLYPSTLSEWRRIRDVGALGANTSIKRGPKPAVRNPMAEELALTKRENARLLRRLEHAEGSHVGRYLLSRRPPTPLNWPTTFSASRRSPPCAAAGSRSSASA